MTIREWSNISFSIHYTEQYEMQRMAKQILSNADHIENEETPGHSYQALSRVITATSDLIDGTKYIIHIEGFTVTHITECIK